MWLKRFFDVLVAKLMLLLLAPLLVVVAGSILYHDLDPVFYFQTRVGRYGKRFGMLKFRSIVTEADQIGGCSTQRGDPRILPIGHFLRRTSLDELPQLVNVLLGDMSLVESSRCPCATRWLHR